MKHKDLEITAQGLLDSARDAVIGLDGDGRILCSNPAVTRLLGVERDKLTGTRIEDLLGQDLLRRVRKEGLVDSWPLETVAGERLVNLSHNLLDPERPEAGAGLFLRDVSESVRLRRSLEHSERLSQLGKMAAGIAHEVGNPLAGISSIVQGLLRGMEEPDPARERLTMVRQQVARITAILRQLVEYSRPAGKSSRPLDLNELIRDAARLLRYDSRARGVDLTLELDDQLPHFAAQPHQIQQLFLNLMQNALDATDGSSYRAVRVTSRLQGDQARFTVEDTGPGLGSAELERIFDPFYTTKDPGKGTGLGLWICKGITDSLGGRLFMGPGTMQGACFVVELELEKESC